MTEDHGFTHAQGVSCGYCCGTCRGVALMGLGCDAVFVATQQVILFVLLMTDVITRRRQRASLKCPHCYGESTLPGYRCIGPGCTVVHWSMLPGALGLFTRRCSCGTRLPNTVGSAAKALVPVCPFCQHNLVEGSGARQTIQLALIGSVGAGKTRLLGAATVAIERVLREFGGDTRHRRSIGQAIRRGQSIKEANS